MIKNVLYVFLIACITFSFITTYNLTAENTSLKNAMQKYKVANGGNVGRDRLKTNLNLYENIEQETGVPKELMQSFGIYENLADNYAFGIKRIPMYIIMNYKVDEYQPRALARIMTQEAFSYVLKDDMTRKAFLQQLTERYCRGNKQYGRELNKIYCEVVNEVKAF